MRTKGTAAELERRRCRAVELVDQGESPAVVARILGVTRSSLHRWRRMARSDGGLAAKPATGAKRHLSDPQLKELEGLLAQGAPAHGFANEPWTSVRLLDPEPPSRLPPGGWLAVVLCCSWKGLSRPRVGSVHGGLNRETRPCPAAPSRSRRRRDERSTTGRRGQPQGLQGPGGPS
jgi:putative transposase